MLFAEESESPMSLCRHLCAAGLLNYTGGEGDVHSCSERSSFLDKHEIQYLPHKAKTKPRSLIK